MKIPLAVALVGFAISFALPTFAQQTCQTRKGYWGAVEVREGDDWKIEMDTWNLTPAPAK